MPIRSSSASSIEHWNRMPPPTAAPTAQAMAFVQPLRATRMVVSISSKPMQAAVAASAAICSGSSLALVTWAWLPGRRRARSLAWAKVSSRVERWPATSASLAGVMPRASRTTCGLGTWKSTRSRA